MSRRSVLPLILAAAFLGACSNTTGGALISLPFLAGGCNVCTSSGVNRTSASQPFTFTNLQGWTVTLTQAWVDLGPFYFNAYAPNSTAFMSGTIIMEVPTQVVVNALDPTLFSVPGGVSGETGTSVAVQIELLSPDVTVPLGLQLLINGDGNGGVGYVAGSATYGATTVKFAGPMLITQELASPAMPLPYWQRVPGAGETLDFTDTQQTVEMRVDPTHWFDNVEFTAFELGVSEPDGGMDPGPLAATNGWPVGSTFNQDLVQGLQTGSGVYFFSMVPGNVSAPVLYSGIPDGGI